jgi:transcriptional regulator with XRE-family HTH domain
MKSLDDILKGLDPARRKKIAARTAELLAEEQSLQELRRARKLTQETIADALGVGQDSVSRLEQRNDLLVSTVRGYVEALGGRLLLVAEFPNQPPVVLSGIAAPPAERDKRVSKHKAPPTAPAAPAAPAASARRAPRVVRGGRS